MKLEMDSNTAIAIMVSTAVAGVIILAVVITLFGCTSLSHNIKENPEQFLAQGLEVSWIVTELTYSFGGMSDHQYELAEISYGLAKSALKIYLDTGDLNAYQEFIAELQHLSIAARDPVSLTRSLPLQPDHFIEEPVTIP